MQVILVVWLTLQNVKFVWSENCVQAKDYVCTQIPAGYPPGVTSLVLFVSNMEEINTTLFNSSNLASVTSLTMTQCGITSILPAAFSHFQNLKSLNLHNNAVSQVTSAWFTHKKVLESLIIANNSIVALNDDSFHGLSELSSLNLSQNQISTITSGSFNSLIRLRYLDLSNNKLSHLDMNTLVSVNTTKIALHGNPWDCSCSMYQFVLYLRELQKALLLQNEREVLCNSPAYLRGIPVWNVSRCVNPTTAVGALTTNSEPLNPGGIKPSALISLIEPVKLIPIILPVVLCALVFVICVLSVLYHRKRERKHRQTIKPSPLEKDHAKHSQPNCTATDKSKSCQHKTMPNNRVLLTLDQTVLESETLSHIFQIYSKAPDPKREVCTRAKSAGPEFFSTWGGRHVDSAVHEDLTEPHLDMKGKEVFFEKNESEDKKGEQRKKETEKNDDDDTESKNSLKTVAKMIWMMDAEVKEENTVEENARCKKEAAKDLSFNVARSFEEDKANTLQLLEDGENMPYLTIGPDPEKHTLNLRPALSKKEKSRPMKRVLSWPPTAAQWKKHWSQNQQVLNVSPHLVFLTQYTYHLSPEYQSCVQVRDSLEPSGESGMQSYIQGWPALSDDYTYINEQSDLKSFPPSDYGAQSISVTSYNPLQEQTSLRGVSKASVKIKSKKKKTNRAQVTSRCEHDGPGSGPGSVRQPWRKDWKEGKSEKNQVRKQPGSDSGPSGLSQSTCSPSDDNLLVGNEYTFIDLLHEVVENQGRWTREHWRQSHINKCKNKQFGKSQ